MAYVDFDEDGRRARRVPVYDPPDLPSFQTPKPGPYVPVPTFDSGMHGRGDEGERGQPRSPSQPAPSPAPTSPSPNRAGEGQNYQSGQADFAMQFHAIAGRAPNAEDWRDFENLWRSATDPNAPKEWSSVMAAYAPYIRQRFPGGGGNNGTGSSGASSTASRPAAFSDPLGGPVDAAAAARAARLNNPPADSGQAMLEAALKKIAAQFEQGGYTPGEMEQFQTQAIDPLERLRTARRQQVMQELSRRGIPPTSGVAISMLADADRQFDALRSQQQTQIGTQAANERQSRMLKSLELLSGLASTEEGRLDKAFDYTKVPLELGDRAFSQAMQLFGQTNPSNLFNPAMQIANMGQGQQNSQSAMIAMLADLISRSGGR